jgi:hypothetical protein
MWEDPGRDTRQRLSVAEAADALGITVDAVRSRVKRGTIAHERKGARVYVLLGADESRPGHDQYADQVGDQGPAAPEDRTAQLIATLQEQLAEEREARRRADTIIAQLARANEEQARTIRELEAPSEPSSEPRESPETVEEEPERAEPRPAKGEVQEGVQRSTGRSLWRRMFGG